MKKFIYAFAGAVALLLGLSSCSMFKYDTLEGPNAQINGRLLDVVTGEKIGVETSSSDAGALVVIEQGWDGEEEQSWLVRFDGMYTNNLVFASEYVFSTKKLPCYQPENNKFTVARGKNRMDISLLPFCRILNPVLSYEGGKIVATFSVELSDPSRANKVSTVALCGNTQVFVGCKYQNLVSTSGKKNPDAKKTDVNPGETITLVVDPTLDENKDLFRYKQDRYFRIAAMAEGNSYNGNKYYNFSATFKVPADYETNFSYTVVEWNENEW